ncbi:signal peptide containing protein, putative [Babesia ovata]|uniref:Signal peptide containing protein, putative n=1 Tax=Babesia ovata TaxID=189622 RepID=A0A2H6KBA0_9APIC|nr:signal peptide containing protein, putative [Babesia ovata]GBE60266.1 signal peptide containing protein, putative [Babesia ovata]
MYSRRLLKYLAAAAFWRWLPRAMSLLHIRDGPIGLPSNVSIRAEHRHHKQRKKTEIPSDVPPAKLSTEAVSEIATASHSIEAMRDQLKEEQIQGIHIDLPQIPAKSVLQLIPAFLYSLPSNMMGVKRFVEDSTYALVNMGLQSVLGSQVFRNVLCTPQSNEAEMLICVTDMVANISRVIHTGITVLTLNFRSLVGGKTAADALVRLNTIAANPLNKTLMKVLGTTAVLYITMMRESVPDETKVLAGSIMTELTSLPIVSNIPDTSSGGFGRVNVVLPRPSRMHRADYDIAKLQAGAGERDLLSSIA